MSRILAADLHGGNINLNPAEDSEGTMATLVLPLTCYKRAGYPIQFN